MVPIVNHFDAGVRATGGTVVWVLVWRVDPDGEKRWGILFVKKPTNGLGAFAKKIGKLPDKKLAATLRASRGALVDSAKAAVPTARVAGHC